MKKEAFKWIHPQFIGSFTSSDMMPFLKDGSGNKLLEITCVGRSNAGKSSLINAFFNTKQLAKSSKEPGKTKLLNLFQIDTWLSLVDLPGYGFAKVSKDEKVEWDKKIPHYLAYRNTLTTLLIVLDSRRGIEEEELTLLDMAQQFQIPYVTIVATKTDKLSKKELLDAEKRLAVSLGQWRKEAQQLLDEAISVNYFLVSSTSGRGIYELKNYLANLFFQQYSNKTIHT